MIFNMSGGGGGAGLNFDVKAYASESALPATAQENTIAVITDAAITSWHFDAVEPAEPVEGMAWIKTGASGMTRFNALKKNALYVYPNACSQYIGGAWVAKDAMLYTGGEWVRWELWLITNGQAAYTIKAIGKQWASGHASMPNPTVTQTADAIEMTGGVGTGMAYFEEIDVTAFKTLTIEGTFHPYYSQTVLAVWSKLGTYINENIVQSVALTETGATLDVSSLSGKYIVGITMYGNYTTAIKNYWLA
jgi:hypothetical protein